MLSDIFGNKIQEIDLKIVQVMQTQNELYSDLESLSVAEKLSAVSKRLQVIDAALNKNMQIWSKFITD